MDDLPTAESPNITSFACLILKVKNRLTTFGQSYLL